MHTHTAHVAVAASYQQTNSHSILHDRSARALCVAAGVFLGLWVENGDGEKNIAAGHFDGFYTYFASEAVSYGSQPHNWPELAR
jgi:hypothetical protein